MFIRYGNHNNRSLLTSYGFCSCDKSDNNSIPISSKLLYQLFCPKTDNNHNNRTKRYECLQRIGFISDNSETNYWITSDSIDWRLETIIRLFSKNSFKDESNDSVVKQMIYSSNICLSNTEYNNYLNLRKYLLEYLLSEYKSDKFESINNYCLKQLLIEEINILTKLISLE